MFKVIALWWRMPRRVVQLGEMLKIQRNCLSGGPYMYGLYNGILLAWCLLTDQPYEPLSIPEELCKKES
jgi:hypothetical protein